VSPGAAVQVFPSRVFPSRVFLCRLPGGVLVRNFTTAALRTFRGRGGGCGVGGGFVRGPLGV
jgi:hypothetical protein